MEKQQLCHEGGEGMCVREKVRQIYRVLSVAEGISLMVWQGKLGQEEQDGMKHCVRSVSKCIVVYTYRNEA